jgi:hypothetical protein
MKNLFTFLVIIVLTLKTSGQYVDIKQLKDAGIDIPPQDLLGYGIGNCDLELIKSAIEKGADINYRPEINGTFPLCSAIAAAANVMLPVDYSIEASLIRDEGSNVYSGRSVSDLRRDYIEIIRFLLQKGAKANYVSWEFAFGNPPLLLAAERRDIEIVTLLLDFKADPNSRDMVGYTALHLLGSPAAIPYPYENSPGIAKLLISKGAKMIKNDNGETPLTWAKSNLNMIQSSEFSSYRDLPFYNDLVNSIKILIDIYSKL